MYLPTGIKPLKEGDKLELGGKSVVVQTVKTSLEIEKEGVVLS